MIILADKDEYAMELSRYIHLNPVRGGLVTDPKVYRWSSYLYFIEKDSRPPFLETSFILHYFGKNQLVARERYKKFVEDGLYGGVSNPLEKVEAGAILGGKEFIEAVNKKCGDDIAEDKGLPAVRQLRRLEVAEIEHIVAKYFNRDVDEGLKAGIYFIRRYSGLTLGGIGRKYGKGVHAISKMVSRFEKRIVKDRRLRGLVSHIEDVIETMSNV